MSKPEPNTKAMRKTTEERIGNRELGTKMEGGSMAGPSSTERGRENAGSEVAKEVPATSHSVTHEPPPAPGKGSH